VQIKLLDQFQDHKIIPAQLEDLKDKLDTNFISLTNQIVSLKEKKADMCSTSHTNINSQSLEPKVVRFDYTYESSSKQSKQKASNYFSLKFDNKVAFNKNNDEVNYENLDEFDNK